MELRRSTYYATPQEKPSDADLVAEIRAITDEFECYGYRRVGAELRHRGHVVNAKKVRRLMREHDLNPRRDGVSPVPPTATTTGRSIRSSPAASRFMVPISSG
jgi:transposase InsO family protein